jgi:hypothetical protein
MGSTGVETGSIRTRRLTSGTGERRRQLSNYDFTDEECSKLRDSVTWGVHPKLTKREMRDLAAALAAAMPRETLEVARKRLIALRCDLRPPPSGWCSHRRSDVATRGR